MGIVGDLIPIGDQFDPNPEVDRYQQHRQQTSCREATCPQSRTESALGEDAAALRRTDERWSRCTVMVCFDSAHRYIHYIHCSLTLAVIICNRRAMDYMVARASQPFETEVYAPPTELFFPFYLHLVHLSCRNKDGKLSAVAYTEGTNDAIQCG